MFPWLQLMQVNQYKALQYRHVFSLSKKKTIKSSFPCQNFGFFATLLGSSEKKKKFLDLPTILGTSGMLIYQYQKRKWTNAWSSLAFSVNSDISVLITDYICCRRFHISISKTKVLLADHLLGASVTIWIDFLLGYADTLNL